MKNMACVSWKDTVGLHFLLFCQKIYHSSTVQSVRTIHGTSIPMAGRRGRRPGFVWHSAFMLASQCVCVIYFTEIGNEQGAKVEFWAYRAVWWAMMNHLCYLLAHTDHPVFFYKYGWCFKNLWQSSFPQHEHYWLLKPGRVLLGNYCRFGLRSLP